MLDNLGYHFYLTYDDANKTLYMTPFTLLINIFHCQVNDLVVDSFRFLLLVTLTKCYSHFLNSVWVVTEVMFIKDQEAEKGSGK